MPFLNQITSASGDRLVAGGGWSVTADCSEADPCWAEMERLTRGCWDTIKASHCLHTLVWQPWQPCDECCLSSGCFSKHVHSNTTFRQHNTYKTTWQQGRIQVFQMHWSICLVCNSHCSLFAQFLGVWTEDWALFYNQYPKHYSIRENRYPKHYPIWENLYPKHYPICRPFQFHIHMEGHCAVLYGGPSLCD